MKQSNLLVSAINSLFFSRPCAPRTFIFIPDPCFRLEITMSGASLCSDITCLAETVQSRNGFIDEAARIKALKAAKSLVAELSSPIETAIQDVSLV